MSAEALLATARAKGLTVATAESCTGGLLAGAITDPAGASTIFERGWITYSNAAKAELLGVSEDTLAHYGAVSEAVATEMANGARERSGASIAISVTGIAGPGGSESKPEGRVCFAVATQHSTEAGTVDFGPLSRANVRAASVAHALALLLAAVQREP